MTQEAFNPQDISKMLGKDNEVKELREKIPFGVSKHAYYQYDEDAALAKAARESFALQYIPNISTNKIKGTPKKNGKNKKRK